jgi:enamine deaminase RidA (YjgF/YER057c/UK114 family)
VSDKIVLTSKHLPPPIGVWSHAVQIPPGRTLIYPSGFTSRDNKGNVVAPNDAAGQMRQILTNLKAFVEEVGATLEDVVKVTLFTTRIDQFSAIHAVRREFFPKDPPASTMVQVVRMVEPTHVLEMEAVVLAPLKK